VSDAFVHLPHLPFSPIHPSTIHLIALHVSILFPLVVTVASGCSLVVHVISYSWNNSQWVITEDTGAASLAPNREAHSRLNQFRHKVIQHARNHGGLVIFGFKIARLVGCLTLFSLSLATLLLNSEHSAHQGLMLSWDGFFSVDNLPQIAMTGTFVSIMITDIPYNMLTKRTAVYFLPCYNFSRSEQLEPTRNCHNCVV
jgi:hypothetical protein